MNLRKKRREKYFMVQYFSKTHQNVIYKIKKIDSYSKIEYLAVNNNNLDHNVRKK